MLFAEKAPSQISGKPSRTQDQVSEVSYKTGSIHKQISDKISVRSYGTSSIRTTTTTRERLADIEK